MPHRLAIVALSLLAVSLSACRTPVALPSDTAAPEVVLQAYLGSLVAGDCATGRLLAAETFANGNGELCGATDVRSFRVNGYAGDVASGGVVFATRLETTGTADGSVAPGGMVWFYSLEQGPDGAWRIVGGGSGP